jgi:hypothetical protein
MHTKHTETIIDASESTGVMSMGFSTTRFEGYGAVGARTVSLLIRGRKGTSVCRMVYYIGFYRSHSLYEVSSLCTTDHTNAVFSFILEHYNTRTASYWGCPIHPSIHPSMNNVLTESKPQGTLQYYRGQTHDASGTHTHTPHTQQSTVEKASPLAAKTI